MYSEDELLPISALQHLLYCERQCALIHIEQVWQENRLTVEGRNLHDRVDAGGSESRRDVRTAFGLRLRCLRLGLTGKPDGVEFHNTLFITTQGAYLCHEGEAVLARVEKETRLRVPIHSIGGIICFGQVSCSPPQMGLCGERGVAISFLTEHGRFQARGQGPVSGNVLLRREQYRRADDGLATAAMARAFLIGKRANCWT